MGGEGREGGGEEAGEGEGEGGGGGGRGRGVSEEEGGKKYEKKEGVCGRSQRKERRWWKGRFVVVPNSNSMQWSNGVE